MNINYYTKIAELMLFAVNFKEGDKLLIQINHDCRDAARVLAFLAYKKGAAFVDINYLDSFLHSSAINAGKSSPYFPEYEKARLLEICKTGWKTISYLSFAETDEYAKLPADILTSYFTELQKYTSERRKFILNSGGPWSLTFIPTAATAKKVFCGLPEEEALDEFWKVVIKIMHLDSDDPVEYWKKKLQKDKERSNYLTELAPEFIEFKGPGTDLRVGVNKNARWMGGLKKAKTGELFAANLPTDEIFTSPDCRRADGRVSLTRPFVMHQNLGDIPEDAWFEFKEGRVVDYGARKGENSLDNLFKRDERARYLGELAIVDPFSPFAAPGLTYFNGLYDENAACHLALGAAYLGTLKKDGDFSEKELLDMGINTASVHEDMMVGSPKVDVVAVCLNKRRVDIIKDGKLLI